MVKAIYTAWKGIACVTVVSVYTIGCVAAIKFILAD